MDVVSSARVSVLPSAGEVPRVAAAPAPDSVKTELPAQATVQQTGAPEGPTNEAAGREPGSPAELTHKVTVDASTQELVFQKINERSGEVVRQVPDQAILRMRAYARELRQAGTKPQGSSPRVERIA